MGVKGISPRARKISTQKAQQIGIAGEATGFATDDFGAFLFCS
ncbi:MAG TPA: hypothetical protein PLX84_03330 [Acidiphilium sp.]|nr:hypothetical protein [Acidiphilium sp.]